MKIKKIIFAIVLSLICIEKGNTEINDALFMTVGNKPITKSDVVDEIKILLILNNESYADHKREKLHEIAVKNLVRRNMKKIEIERNKFFEFNQADLEKQLIKIANQINMDVDTLKNICESNDLDFSLIVNQIRTELFWNGLIFELYKNTLVVNPEEIEEQLKLLQNKEPTNEYLISEILVKILDKNNLESEVKELKNKIEINGFENVARNLSISASSANDGDLGWLNENIISKKIKTTILNTPIGTLSNPILLPDGILIFKLRDKRSIDNNLSLEEAKEHLVSSEKLKILNMHSLSHYDKLIRTISVKFFQ